MNSKKLLNQLKMEEKADFMVYSVLFSQILSIFATIIINS